LATYSAISGTGARSLLLLLAVAADAALVYSWSYGLPAATAQASCGT